MVVVKTTSPCASPPAPKLRPRNTRPSASAKAASAGGAYLDRRLIAGTGVAISVLPITVPLISTNKRQLRATPQLHPEQRSIGATRREPLEFDAPCFVRVEDHNVGGRTRIQRPAGHPPQARGDHAQVGDHVAER